MAYGKTLKILPSVTVGSDGTKAEWGQLPGKDQEWIEEAFCRRISKNLSDYYSAHQAEWERLAAEFSQE